MVGSSDFWARNGRHAVNKFGKAPVGRTHQECRRVILVPSSWQKFALFEGAIAK